MLVLYIRSVNRHNAITSSWFRGIILGYKRGVSDGMDRIIIRNSDNWPNITSSSPAFLEIMASHL